MSRIKVGVLGCSGVVGQRYLAQLVNHPWFEVTFLAASSRSKGRTLYDVLEQKGPLVSGLADEQLELPVYGIDEVNQAERSCELVFSCIGDKEAALTWEEAYARRDLMVVSNTSAFRSHPLVPVVIPEINPHHLEALLLQRKAWGLTRGGIVAKPNCTVQSYLTPLFALHKKWGLKRAIVTTMQAVSGAGYPGVSSLDIVDNIIPLIEGEEEKSEGEPLKILGELSMKGFCPLETMAISAHCNRVPVVDGHTACLSVEFDRAPTLGEVEVIWRNFRGRPQELALPSAPKQPIIVRNEANRPQPRLDRNVESGMGVVVGRLRSCPVLHIRFVGLSHNAIRGAAGGGILNAELIVQGEFWQ